MEQEKVRRDLRLLTSDMDEITGMLKAYEEYNAIINVRLFVSPEESWGSAVFTVYELEPDTQTEIMFAIQNDLERKKLKYKQLLEQELKELDNGID